MDALEALHTRNSVAMLEGPGPSTAELDQIFSAGLRACDHRRLRPWKFLLIEGEAREDLGALMLEVALQNNPDLSPEKQEKVLAKPLRAPTIIIVVAAVQAEASVRVPEIEQILSAGGAAQLMMVAAHALGIGAIWRTGSISFDRRFVQGLNLEEQDQIVGLLYMGTAKVTKTLEVQAVAPFVTRWSR